MAASATPSPRVSHHVWVVDYSHDPQSTRIQTFKPPQSLNVQHSTQLEDYLTDTPSAAVPEVWVGWNGGGWGVGVGLLGDKAT